MQPHTLFLVMRSVNEPKGHTPANEYCDACDRASVKCVCTVHARAAHTLSILAAAKDRQYLESLNLKQLQKDRKPAEDQDKREFYQELQDLAKSGPLFQEDTLGLVEGLPELPKHVAKWLANLSAKGSRDIDPRGLNLIVDWANGDPESRKIQNMTWDQAMEAQKAWHESTFEVHDTGDYNTKDVVQDLGGGWTMVRINNEHDLDVEGDLMGHCVGGDGYWEDVQSGEAIIYSLRDPQNKPHVTIEVSKGRVQQCYGKQNVAPVKKYNPYLIKFFEKQNLLDGILHLEDTSDVSATTWAALAKHSSDSLRAKAAINPSTPKKLLITLAKDPSVNVRHNVAKNKAIPVDTLKLLANDPIWHIRATAAANPSTPEDVLELLAKDSDSGVRASVVSNPYVTVKLLERLAKDPGIDVRNAVAMLPGAPAHVLAILANDSSWQVVDNVASNTGTPASVLRQLAQNPDTKIRHIVIRNKSTPVDVLELLTNDPDAGLQSAARMALKSRGITTAALKDRSYLESLNLKQLQKDRKPAEDQDKREFYQELQDLAKSGPLFETPVLDLVEGLPELPKHVTKWLANLAKADVDIDPRGLNLILDWVRGDNTANIQSMTWDQAMEAQKAWHESTFEVQDTGEYGSKNVVYKFPDGWTFVEVDNEHDLDVEGDLMGHCVGGDNYARKVESGASRIFSLRDPSNNPHVTIEYTNTGGVRQCFGKQNEHPVRKYHKYIVEFFINYLDMPSAVSQHRLVVDPSMYPTLLKSDYSSARVLLASQPDLPEDMLLKLAEDDVTAVRVEVASRKQLPDDVFDILLKDKASNVQQALAHYHKLTPQQMMGLLEHADRNVAYFIARTATDEDIQMQVIAAFGNDDRVMGALASSKHASIDVLEAVSDANQSDLVSRFLFTNPNTTWWVINKRIPYAEDAYLVLSERRNVPKDTAQLLFELADATVDLGFASNHPAGLPYLEKIYNRYKDDVSRIISISYALADNPNTPPKVLLAMAENKLNLRGAYAKLAANPNIPAEAARILADTQFGDLKVRMALLKNPNVPKSVKDIAGR